MSMSVSSTGRILQSSYNTKLSKNAKKCIVLIVIVVVLILFCYSEKLNGEIKISVQTGLKYFKDVQQPGSAVYS